MSEQVAVVPSAVITEILAGDALGMGAAAKCIPPYRGEKANPSTPWRWIREGVHTAGGDVIKLEGARIGGRWLTSRAAIARFMSILTAASSPATDVTPAPKPARSKTTARKRSEMAAQKLEARGA